MPQRIHVQDDLFFLTIMLRTLKDGMTIEIDAEIFLEKVIEDIAFLDSSLKSIAAFLDQNPRLIDRQEYLHSLLTLEKQYSEFLSGALNRDYAFSDELEPHRARFSAMWDAHRSVVASLQEQLALGRDDSSLVDIVSRDELSGLLGEGTEA